jgi:hypothetical protein
MVPVWKLLFLNAFLAMLCFPTSIAAQKLTPEEVVAKHLASIGPAEKLAGIRTRTMEGRARLDVLVGGGIPIAGSARVASDGPKYRVALEFLRQNYWGEQYMTDGEKVEVGFILPGRRSQLGDFLSKFPDIVREGLLGGVLNTAWPLLSLEQHQPKLEYDGLKKVDKRQLHRLTYKMRKGGSQVTIYLFFEPETFRHIRTIIEREEAAGMPATPSQPVAGSQARYRLEEEFADFVQVEGLNLPTLWTIRMTAEKAQSVSLGTVGSTILRWTVGFDKLQHNAEIQPAQLAIEPPGRIAEPKQP